MLGQLNDTQINNLLSSQVIGRLACTDGNFPYVIPVTYMYDGKNIYGQTSEGMKLNILRKNPNVCFEVDMVMDMANWQCVVLRGKFEELKGQEALKAREFLFDRVYPMMTSSTIHAHQHEVTCQIDDNNRVKPVMYRIEILEKTGRFEKK